MFFAYGRKRSGHTQVSAAPRYPFVNITFDFLLTGRMFLRIVVPCELSVPGDQYRAEKETEMGPRDEEKIDVHSAAGCASAESAAYGSPGRGAARGA